MPTVSCSFCNQPVYRKPSDIPKYLRFFCSTQHYHAFCKGKPKPQTHEEVLRRFWDKVDISGPDKCWEWQAGKGWWGYGKFRAPQNGSIGAHRFIYEQTYGAIEDGLFVLHRCDNPPCVNPLHLFLGTQADNLQDAINKNRLDLSKAGLASAIAQRRNPNPYCPNGHLYTDTTMVFYRNRRNCLICRRAKVKRGTERKRRRRTAEKARAMKRRG